MDQLVRAGALRNYLEISKQLGLNPLPILRAVGLSRAMLDEPERQIPLAAVVRLLEISAADSGCITLGLRMAESRQLAHLGAVSLLLTHQRTLRDALNTTIQYRHLLNESLALQFEAIGRNVIIREELVTGTGEPSRQCMELAIGVLARACRAFLGTHWHPVTVNFTHGAPDDLQVHRRLFHCRIVFNSSFNGIVCDAASLEAPNPIADPIMCSYAEQFMHSLESTRVDSIVLDVRRAIYLLLPVGRATVEQIAQGLGLHPRSLQLRLAESDAKFSDLLNVIRRELVTRYIDNPNYSLQQVGEMLGYGIPTSFARWFTSEFGLPPRQWRKDKKVESSRKILRL